MKVRGKFITIEGTEGAGKSTALQFIQDYLIKHGIKAVFTREPGGTEVAEEIRNLLLHTQSSEKIAPKTELLLMFAGRAQHIHQKILPALESGDWVVSDRYIDASYAYQSGARGIPVSDVKVLDELVVGSLYPDLTFLLDIPADLGLERTEKRGSLKDRIEQEKIDFFVCVRDAYLQRAQQDTKRIKIIDAKQSIEKVQEQIQHHLEKLLSEK